MKGYKWNKKELNSKDLKKDFHCELVAILQYIKLNDSKNNAHTKREPGVQKTIYQNSTEKEELPFFYDQITIKDIMELSNKQLKEESDEKIPFSISLWDLGGRDEFISTHHLFLDAEATILIVHGTSPKDYMSC